MAKSFVKSNKNNIYPNIKGAIAENFVIAELEQITNNKQQYYYAWHGNQNESNKKGWVYNNSKTCYEVGLCLEDNEARIIPVEVKFGKDFSTSSLKRLVEGNKPPYAIALSSKNININKETNVIELPIYLVSFLELSMNRINLKK